MDNKWRFTNIRANQKTWNSIVSFKLEWHANNSNRFEALENFPCELSMNLKSNLQLADSEEATLRSKQISEFSLKQPLLKVIICVDQN